MRAIPIMDGLFYIALAATFISTPFLVVNWTKFVIQRRRATSAPSRATARFPVKSVAFFVTPALLAVVAASVATTMTRRAVLSFLQQPPDHFRISVDGRVAENPDAIVSCLRTTSSYWAHHTHPTTRIRIEISDSQRTVILVLGRDSGITQEYWVFYPAGGITSSNEIGRVTTSLFDSY